MAMKEVEAGNLNALQGYNFKQTGADWSRLEQTGVNGGTCESPERPDTDETACRFWFRLACRSWERG